MAQITIDGNQCLLKLEVVFVSWSREKYFQPVAILETAYFLSSGTQKWLLITY